MEMNTLNVVVDTTHSVCCAGPSLTDGVKYFLDGGGFLKTFIE